VEDGGRLAARRRCGDGAWQGKDGGMPVVYVATSKGLANWGGDVGLSKHLYKIGVAEEGAEAAVKALNDSAHAGETDWRLVRKETVDEAEEATLLERVARKEKLVEPRYYPKIKGAPGIVRVKPVNAENYFLVKRALAGGPDKPGPLKPVEIAEYLIRSALD
jgi:hypothetical protein